MKTECCYNCKYWSERIAEAGPEGILAMCLNQESPQHSKMTGKYQTCEKFEEGLSVDDPKKEIKHTSFKLTPSQKEEVIENFLTDTFGFDRRESIKAARCAPLPIGCGKPVEGFRDALSEREFGISGLCQKCQDKIFG